MKKYILLLLVPFLAACSNYGSKATSDNIEVYYKDGISKEQAENTARLFDQLLNETSPDDHSKKSFQLLKNGFIEVYDDGVGTPAVKELASFMNSYFSPQTTFSFQLTTNEAKEVIARMVANPDRMSFFTEDVLQEISKGISDKVFNGSPVHFELTDTKFKPLRRYSYPADAAGMQ